MKIGTKKVACRPRNEWLEKVVEDINQLQKNGRLWKKENEDI